jgi:ketosteroid isomerase-like protein
VATDEAKLLELYGDLAQRSIDAYNRRDPDAFTAVWRSDCEWHPFLTARVEGDPGYHGHNGLRAWFEDLDEMFEDAHGELGDIRLIGDRVVGLGHLSVRGRGSGAEVRSEVGWVLEVSGELISRGWAYTTHAEALAAAESAG